MARKEGVQYFDDIDQSPLTQEELNVIRFSVNGANYIMELSSQHAQEFEQTISRYTSVARRDTETRARRRNVVENRVPTSIVRQWAISNGKTVAARGKVPQEIFDQYYQAHNM